MKCRSWWMRTGMKICSIIRHLRESKAGLSKSFTTGISKKLALLYMIYKIKAQQYITSTTL